MTGAEEAVYATKITIGSWIVFWVSLTVLIACMAECIVSWIHSLCWWIGHGLYNVYKLAKVWKALGRRH